MANGNVLHDSHAEILAVRAFNRFLLEECKARAISPTPPSAAKDCVVERTDSMEWLRQSGGCSATPFEMKFGVRILMFCSEAPCGDASMELIMAQQEDATPWTPKTAGFERQANDAVSDPLQADTQQATEVLYGRGYFDKLGVVRRKPSRPDAPPANSKSCSDKLALKQCTSLLSSITSLIVDPSKVFLHTLVLPCTELVPGACTRAFSSEGRFSILSTSHNTVMGNYGFRPFSVSDTPVDFAYSRRVAKAAGATTVVPSNLTAAVFGATQETIINGVLQGRKMHDPKGASALSRRRMWLLAKDVADMVGNQAVTDALTSDTYACVKNHALLSERRKLKNTVRTTALRGWRPGTADRDWSLEHPPSAPLRVSPTPAGT